MDTQRVFRLKTVYFLIYR